MAKPFTKTQLIIAFSLLIIITIIPSVIYIINFSSHNTSSDPANWGTFGDFIGGTTNVILGIINIVITAYIAYLIKSVDDKRFEDQKIIDELKHQQNIELQNNIFIRSLREDVLKEFNSITQNLIDSIMYGGNVKTIKDDVAKTTSKYIHLISNNEHIFNVFRDKEKSNNLYKTLDPINDFCEKSIELHEANMHEPGYFPIDILANFMNNIKIIRYELINEILSNNKVPNYIPEKINKKTSE